MGKELERLAKYMRKFFPEEIEEIYNPFCGDGWLLKEFDDDTKKYGLDIEAEKIKEAEKQLKNFEGRTADALAFKMGNKFNWIIAVPPLVGEWNPEKACQEMFEGWPCLPIYKRPQFAYIAHVLDALTVYGTAAVLMPMAAMWRKANEQDIRKYLIDKGYIARVTETPEDMIPGTGIKTVVVTLTKAPDRVNLVGFADKEGHVVLVKPDKIAEHEYDLTPEIYLSEKRKTKDETKADE